MKEDIAQASKLLTESPWVKWFFGAALLLAGIGIAMSFIGAAAKVATAPARVLSKTMDTNNIIQSYEWFYDVNAAFDARRAQVVQFKGLFETEEDKDERSRLRIDMAAQQHSCRVLATKYNANSQKMNKSIFKGWTLPDTLNMQLCA